MKIKISIFILSIVYCFYLITLLVASHYNSSILNPLNSEYYYLNGALTKAIELEPSKAKYHMYYALDLLNNLPKDTFLAHMQLSLLEKELYRAVKLKPYDKMYKKTYDIYSKWMKEQKVSD